MPKKRLLKKILNNKKFSSKALKNSCKYGVGDIDEIKNNEKFIIVLQHPVTTELSLSNKHMKETLKAVNKTQLKNNLMAKCRCWI